MSRVTIIMLIILVILIAVLIFLYFYGKKLQARQTESEAQIQAMKQPMTLLVIDKKKLKESGLPDQVIQQTPWYAKRSKVCVVKAKVGPQFVNFMCDDKIFDLIPVKKQVKAMVSGIYIVEVKGLRGRLQTDGTPKKKSLLEKLQEKAGAKPVE